jgi:hypothetical protein
MPALRADRVLSGLDFSSGQWAMIGVPLHNFKMLPVQEEMGTFISYDLSLMRTLQQQWDFEMTFEDKCDYHYSLKFYQDGELVRTLGLNLYCGYISFDGLSYAFSPSEFERLRSFAQQIPWSRISFSDLDLLRKAVQTLDNAREVFWYEDVQPYLYPGFCLMSVEGLAWNASVDSLLGVLRADLIRQTGRSDFYLKEYFHIVDGEQMSLRLMLACDEALAEALRSKWSLRWRSHLYNRQSVSILAIGIDEQRYRSLMR